MIQRGTINQYQQATVVATSEDTHENSNVNKSISNSAGDSNIMFDLYCLFTVDIIGEIKRANYTN